MAADAALVAKLPPEQKAMLEALKETRVVRCDEAPWRLLGTRPVICRMDRPGSQYRQPSDRRDSCLLRRCWSGGNVPLRRPDGRIARCRPQQSGQPHQ